MIHCAIIGAGQIGSRHLQALCHLEKPTRVDLVDPSDESLHTARDRYEEAISSSKQDTKLYCHHSLDGLPAALDIVIIATNSAVRKKIIKDVIEKYFVKNFILEKVLFQSKDQFVEVDTLLKESSIPTWVNCWMRTTDLFKQIKSALNLNDPIQMKINGPQWGMGTNSIHFIDLLSFFTGCVDYSFTGVHLKNKVLDSKREGFKEFMGHLEGENSRGDSLDLICNDEQDGPITIEIRNGLEKFTLITNFADHFNFISSNDLASRLGKVSLPYQSEMTHIWVNDILTKGSCDLPIYANSMNLHLELISVFTEHLKKITGKEIDACPIT
jgi:predicted dehydrogenase